MLQRYLGNKSALNDDIVNIVRQLAPAGAHVCDAFSGSISVSAALKRSGFRVSSNDVNLLSWVYAVAFLRDSKLPRLNVRDLIGPVPKKSNVSSLRPFLPPEKILSDWSELLDHLLSPYRKGEVPREYRRTDFFDHYCEAGRHSAFKSTRGAAGRRRFFTAENAQTLDRAINRIRYWWRTERISEHARCFLTSCLLDGLEKVANTQGTYHDFPRDFYDPRALKPLAIKMPDLDTLLSGPPAVSIGKGMDSLDFMHQVEPHAVLYLDPPYNFRQYTAYYFLPNLVAVYPELENPEDYFKGVQFVRGQNMESDFTSTFCSSKRFLESLGELVRASKSDYVVLSYFNGKNHWHDFKSGTSDKGRSELEEFFASELFERGSLRCHPIDRQNYQSYGGYKALTVSEYLFVAKRATCHRRLARTKEPAYAVV